MGQGGVKQDKYVAVGRHERSAGKGAVHVTAAMLHAWIDCVHQHDVQTYKNRQHRFEACLKTTAGIAMAAHDHWDCLHMN